MFHSYDVFLNLANTVGKGKIIGIHIDFRSIICFDISFADIVWNAPLLSFITFSFFIMYPKLITPHPTAWATLHPKASYTAPCRSTLHPTGLCYTLRRATLNPAELRCTLRRATLLRCILLGYATPSGELPCTLRSYALPYAAPYWAKMHHTELRKACDTHAAAYKAMPAAYLVY